VETIREKTGEEGKKVSPVSLPEPCVLVWQRVGFPRGSEERWLPSLDADTPVNYPNSCGHIPWLSVNRGGQLPQQLWTISAIALDKR
jgi:hypothetical protein